jgi:hypothetical protein
MPVTVSFVLTRSYLQGSVTVEGTDDPQRAIEVVRQMDPAELIEHTCESEWDVDAWIDEPLPTTSAAEKGAEA